jgi:hypothetical protein
MQCVSLAQLRSRVFLVQSVRARRLVVITQCSCVLLQLTLWLCVYCGSVRGKSVDGVLCTCCNGSETC